MTLVEERPLLKQMVTMEMADMVERWHFDGEAIHVLLALPTRACDCHEEHAWFINRDGRTRCCICDAAYLREKREARARGGQ